MYISALRNHNSSMYSALVKLVHCVNNEGSFFRSNWGRVRHLIRLVITQYVEVKLRRDYFAIGKPIY